MHPKHAATKIYPRYPTSTPSDYSLTTSIHLVTSHHSHRYPASSIRTTTANDLRISRGKMANEASIALTNRALRTIKTVRNPPPFPPPAPPFSILYNDLRDQTLTDHKQELEFLTDSSVISPQQLSSILSQLPAQTQLHAPIQSPVPSTVQQISNLSLNEKSHYAPSPAPAPPAYASGPQVLSLASALYAYTPTDAGDLALQQNDRVQVTEHMNIDCKSLLLLFRAALFRQRPFSMNDANNTCFTGWRGRNERTGLEGIFPRSYVNIVEEKRPHTGSPNASNYGNMPLDVSQSSNAMTPVEGKKPSKFEENGKKFGKKMGNAAIFGAGATIGSNIVNGIF